MQDRKSIACRSGLRMHAQNVLSQSTPPRGDGTGPAGPVSARPLFGDQVINIQMVKRLFGVFH